MESEAAVSLHPRPFRAEGGASRSKDTIATPNTYGYCPPWILPP